MPPHVRFTHRRTCNVTNFVTRFSFGTCAATFTPVLNCKKQAERKKDDGPMVTVVPTLLRSALWWLKKTECHKTDMLCYFDIFWSNASVRRPVMNSNRKMIG